MSVVICSDGKTRRTLTYEERLAVRAHLNAIARDELAAQQRNRTTWECEYCGEPFTPRVQNKGKQKYCTEKCGSAAMRARHARERQAVA